MQISVEESMHTGISYEQKNAPSRFEFLNTAVSLMKYQDNDYELFMFAGV